MTRRLSGLLILTRDLVKKAKPNISYARGIGACLNFDISNVSYLNHVGWAIVYLQDRTCNLEVEFLVFYQMEHMNLSGISYSFWPRSRPHQSKIPLKYKAQLVFA